MTNDLQNIDPIQITDKYIMADGDIELGFGALCLALCVTSYKALYIVNL